VENRRQATYKESLMANITSLWVAKIAWVIYNVCRIYKNESFTIKEGKKWKPPQAILGKLFG
jgi:hypothetical protein